jgi:hypothetical protein
MKLCELKRVLNVFIFEQPETKKKKKVRTGLQTKQAATRFILRTGYSKGKEDAGSL